MLPDVFKSFRTGSMMLFYREGDAVVFLGTTFLVHGDGFLVTTAHILEEHDQHLMVVPYTPEENFMPVNLESVTPIPVEVARVDPQCDLALLRFGQPMEIVVPDHLIGTPEEITIGMRIACLGYPFGHQRLYNQVLYSAVINSKIITQNGTKMFLFDKMIHDGARGGPVINVEDRRVVGVAGGRFDPKEIHREVPDDGSSQDTNISYAISIAHAVPLLEQVTT